MVRRLIGIVALGGGTLFLGAVPAFAANTITPAAMTAPAAPTYVESSAPTYVEWSAPTYVEWSAPTYVEWSAPTYVEWSAPTYVEWSVPTFVEWSTTSAQPTVARYVEW